MAIQKVLDTEEITFLAFLFKKALYFAYYKLNPQVNFCLSFLSTIPSSFLDENKPEAEKTVRTHLTENFEMSCN